LSEVESDVEEQAREIVKENEVGDTSKVEVARLTEKEQVLE